MRLCMKQLVSRMLKMSASFVLGLSKSSTGTRPPHHSVARTNVVLLIRRTVRPRGYASGFDSPAALLGTRRVLARWGWAGAKAGHFEHPVGGYSSCPRPVGHQSATVPTWSFCSLFGLITALGFFGFGVVWADEGPPLGPRTLMVAL